jgi:hypothetical protein
LPLEVIYLAETRLPAQICEGNNVNNKAAIKTAIFTDILGYNINFRPPVFSVL